MSIKGSRGVFFVLAVLSGAPVFAQVTRRVSLDSGGIQADSTCSVPSISADGRFVAFESTATNITAPNLGAGDPTVSARSAAKGNPISAGEIRTYLVFYRDPIVLGGCPVLRTFNATQSGRVAWSS